MSGVRTLFLGDERIVNFVSWNYDRFEMGPDIISIIVRALLQLDDSCHALLPAFV